MFAAVGIAANSASSAMANVYWSASTPGSWVEFWPDGDTFRIHDTLSDGASAAVQYKLKRTDGAGWYSTKTLVHSGGAGSSGDFIRDFPEDTSIDFRACLYKGGKAYSCSAWTYAYTFDD
ncbi:hypothetical protein [Streptomyces alanosinicus]|uniref:Uncharacterized protein n=1 Tax=Streptomyces alanosinicus TaxID=68171 RepID=A0A919D1U1_9ACTN|nr:hypothetical protein [Streptomyces alanosinicus]GHD99174.1 hypothetical protein GCM10010339_09430 [Streptomyces alanosinicus]